jgi:PKD repeat protein
MKEGGNMNTRTRGISRVVQALACGLTSLVAVVGLAFGGAASAGAATASHGAGGVPGGEPRVRRRPAVSRALKLALAVVFASVPTLVVSPPAAATPGPMTGIVAGRPPIAELPPAGESSPPASAIASPVTPRAVCGSWHLNSSYVGRPAPSTWWEYTCRGSECTGMCNQDVVYASWTDHYVWDGSQPIFYGQWYWPRIDGWTEYWCESWWDEFTGTWYALSCWGNLPPDLMVPRAHFTAACVELGCTFDASVATDPDGEIVGYQWDFGDGSTGSGVTTQHTYNQPGSYPVTLTVTDDAGASGVDTQWVEVVSPNAPPTARFTLTCSGLSCSFNGAGSADSDGTITQYAWAFGDDSSGSGITAQHTYVQPGWYRVTLTVADDASATGVDAEWIEVPPNTPPTASFTLTCSGLSCSFNGTGSADSDGTITQYAWAFGDGSTGSGVTTQHTYNQPGSYPVTLTVTDNAGAPAADTRTIIVSAPNAPPMASFTLTCSGLSCSFDGAGSADSDGTITTYGWNFGDGSSGSGVTVQHVYTESGSYTVTLTVTDNAGATAAIVKSVSLIGLTARGYKVKGAEKVDLGWSRSGAGSFDVYRNGAKIATVAGTGYTDTTGKTGPGRYTYQVCQATAAICSNQVTVTF